VRIECGVFVNLIRHLLEMSRNSLRPIESRITRVNKRSRLLVHLGLAGAEQAHLRPRAHFSVLPGTHLATKNERAIIWLAQGSKLLLIRSHTNAHILTPASYIFVNSMFTRY